MNLVISSFNICHCLDYSESTSLEQDSGIIDVEKFAKAIEEMGADIIGMQEVYNNGDREALLHQPKNSQSLQDIHTFHLQKVLSLIGAEKSVTQLCQSIL